MPVHDHGSRPYEWVGAWSERRAALSPDRVGLVDVTTDRTFTYADLDARANRTARFLRSAGVADGERVAVVSRNRPEYVDLFFATGKTGGVLAPLSHRLAPGELVQMLNDVDPSLLVVEEPFESLAEDVLAHGDRAFETDVRSLPTAADGDPTFAPLADALPSDESPVESASLALDDPHLFLHTGGSTGVPKETVITHGAIYWNSMNTITAWGIRDDDVTPMVFPMFHTGGWNVITVPLFHMGGRVSIAREFDPGRMLSIIESQGATVFIAVPAMLRMMTEHERWEEADLSSLRFAKSGGGPSRDPVMRAWWEKGVEFSQGYGLTECGPNNFAMPDDWPHEKADSVGVPGPHVDVRIVDEDGDPVERGEVGELLLASPHAADRYWHDEAESAETFDEHVHTGDLARRDEAGYVYIEGRKKNMFVSGGENVYPPEVENHVSDHPAVDEVVVLPVADDTWGQVGKAVVEGDESLTIADLTDFLEGRLAKFKWPRHLAFVEEMPTSGPSKIDRRAVEERFGD
ncbi:MAG: AMP-binding protein [Halanaeroarchaeum sp.]